MFFKKLALAMIVCSAPVSFAAGQGGKDFYNKDAEGWFWYKDPVFVEKEPEPEKPEEPKEEPQVIVMEAPADDEAEPKGPPPLSTAWFRANLQDYIDKAIDDPTPENVEAYYLLQRIAMDKAQGFTDMAQQVVAGDPILDEVNRRSSDRASSQSQERMSNENREEMVSAIASSAGLAFFYSSECRLCSNQAVALKNVISRTGMELLPISIDGKPLSNGIFADISVDDAGHADLLGVDKTNPSVFLMSPSTNDWIPVSQGGVTQEALISRILLVATREGLISNEEFNKTRPINVTTSLAKALPSDGELPTDTSELIKYLRGLEK